MQIGYKTQLVRVGEGCGVVDGLQLGLQHCVLRKHNAWAVSA